SKKNEATMAQPAHASLNPQLSTFSRLSTFCKAVERAFDSQSRLLHHVSVNLRRSHVHVPKQLLQRANVSSRLQQMRCKRVPQRMRSHPFVEPRRFGPFPDRVLKGRVQHVMPPLQSRVRVAHDLARRKKPEPFPGRSRPGILPL